VGSAVPAILHRTTAGAYLRAPGAIQRRLSEEAGIGHKTDERTQVV